MRQAHADRRSRYRSEASCTSGGTTVWKSYRRIATTGTLRRGTEQLDPGYPRRHNGSVRVRYWNCLLATVTIPQSDGPSQTLALVAQLRERWLGGDQAWLDEARTLTRNPLAREMARLLHVDLDPLDQMIRERPDVRDSRHFDLGPRPAWLGTQCHNAYPDIRGRHPRLADGGSLDAAQDALVAGWNAQSVLPYLHDRVLGVGLGNDEELEGWYQGAGTSG